MTFAHDYFDPSGTGAFGAWKPMSNVTWLVGLAGTPVNVTSARAAGASTSRTTNATIRRIYFFLARAVYVLPLRSVFFLCVTKSSTCTTPCATRVSVVVQVSWTSHFVPRTVAAL